MEQFDTANAEFIMHNAEWRNRLRRYISIVSAGNSTTMHSAFCILHCERLLAKLKLAGFSGGGKFVALQMGANRV